MTTKTTVTTTTTTTTDPAPTGQRDYILLDRSGSMADKWSDTLGGVNAYAQGLALNPATAGVLVTLALFDSGNNGATFDIIRADVPASAWKSVSPTEAMPRGSTPLFDSIGKLVALARDHNPERAAIIVVTDGFENSSREHTKASAKGLLDYCRKRGWQTIFLGADFDNMSQALDMGNAVRSTMSVSPQNMAAAMHHTSSMRGAYATTGASMDYSDDVKKRMVEKNP